MTARPWGLYDLTPEQTALINRLQTGQAINQAAWVKVMDRTAAHSTS